MVDPVNGTGYQATIPHAGRKHPVSAQTPYTRPVQRSQCSQAAHSPTLRVAACLGFMKRV
jgi:hypothetical protein